MDKKYPKIFVGELIKLIGLNSQPLKTLFRELGKNILR
jgi:hypothetical protein